MMGKIKQKSVFLESEGNEWFERNKTHLHSPLKNHGDDGILSAIKYLSLAPKKVLEVGSSNGWRLAILKELYGTECYGIDPSIKAVSDGNIRFPGISLLQATAENIPFPNESFDMVVLGFCLYLCDRQDLFTIAKEINRVLSDDGYLIVYDFSSAIPYSNSYEYYKNIESYKMDYTKMFDWNPEYNLIFKVTGEQSGALGYAEPDSRLAVSILKKIEKMHILEIRIRNKLN